MSPSKANGYAGKILRVDLTSGRLKDERLSEAELKKWVGGSGFGAKFLYDEVKPGTAWNSPENRLIVASGPLAGTAMGGGGTISITTKGTLTGGAVTTQANGYMGAYMKFAGYDAVIFQGASPKWVYLYMHDGKAELRDAQKYIGLDTWDLEDAIKKDLGFTEKQMSVFGIGPAGENLVKFAGIFGDKDHAAGHNGSGCVMGAKKLKAFCASRGKGGVAVADSERLSAAVKEIWNVIETNPSTRRTFDWGTAGNYVAMDQRMAAGTLPIKNYTTNIYPEARMMTNEYTREHHDLKPNPCWACRMHHLWMVTFKDGPYKGKTVEDPEYEMYAAWGGLIGNTDPDETLWLSNMTTRLGLEGNEAGYLVSMVIELYEKGYLKNEDTDGLELKWGNAAAVKTLLERIAKREGAFANTLAEGTFQSAKKLGPKAQEFGIYTMKGHSPRGHDHRAMWREMFDTVTSDVAMYAASYAGPPDPDSHQIKDALNWKEVSDHTALNKGRRQFEDCLGTCCFVTRVPLALDMEAFNAATGFNFSVQDAKNVGLRLTNVFRAFNLRNGIGVEVEKPSERWWSTPVDGPAKGVSVQPHWDDMIDNFYKLMGWDKKTGKPNPETLKSLGLDYIVKDLYK